MNRPFRYRVQDTGGVIACPATQMFGELWFLDEGAALRWLCAHRGWFPRLSVFRLNHRQPSGQREHATCGASSPLLRFVPMKPRPSDRRQSGESPFQHPVPLRPNCVPWGSRLLAIAAEGHVSTAFVGGNALLKRPTTPEEVVPSPPKHEIGTECFGFSEPMAEQWGGYAIEAEA